MHTFIKVAHESLEPSERALPVDFNALVDILNYGRSSKSNWFWIGKRAFDLVLSIFLIITLSPVLLLSALAIVLESRGSPVFLQYRVGENLRLFTIFKFRTMYLGVPDFPILVKDGGSGKMRRPSFREDGRITAIGKFLRRWSLDELPQLFNVLKGDMSFVGPRPLTVAESTKIPIEALLRYSVPSGITGLGQIRDRSIIHIPERFDHDRDYVSNLGVAQEVEIILGTFGAVLKGQK